MNTDCGDGRGSNGDNLQLQAVDVRRQSGSDELPTPLPMPIELSVFPKISHRLYVGDRLIVAR